MTVENDTFPSDLAFEPEPISPFDPQENTGRRALILLALTFGGLTLIAILVYRLYQPGIRDRADPPFIAADDTPFKTVPEDQIVETDLGSEVYASLEGTADDVTVTLPNRVPADDLPDIMDIDVEPVRTVTAPAPAPAVQARESVRVAEIPKPEPARPAAAQASGGSSDWVVQVASLRSDSEARESFASLASKFSSALPGSAYADIARADLAEKGIYYRVRVVGLADKSSANRLCTTFKAQGQACFVTRR